MWKTKPDYINTELRNGVLVPTDLKQEGWVPNQDVDVKEVVFLFGEKSSVNNNELQVTLLSAQNEEVPQIDTGVDESIIIVIIIAIGAIGAAIFFLKGYRKSP